MLFLTKDAFLSRLLTHLLHLNSLRIATTDEKLVVSHAKLKDSLCVKSLLQEEDDSKQHYKRQLRFLDQYNIPCSLEDAQRRRQNPKHKKCISWMQHHLQENALTVDACRGSIWRQISPYISRSNIALLFTTNLAAIRISRCSRLALDLRSMGEMVNVWLLK